MCKQRPHVVYRLSLWQASTADKPMWRAWLENPCTGQRRGFGTLEGLMRYLQHEMNLLECAADAPPAPPATDTSAKPGTAE